MPANLARQIDAQTAVIANGGTVSAAIRTVGAEYLGISLSAAFTGIALTYQVSADNVTYQLLCDAAGATITTTVAAGKSYALPVQLIPWPWFKVVSGSAEGAARTLTVVSKG